MISDVGFLNQFDRKDSRFFFGCLVLNTLVFVKDLNRVFLQILDFGFSGFESLIDHTNSTNIQFGRSRSKRIIARFPRFCFYGPDRRNTMATTGFPAIFLEAP
jgi:hypothetical protein